jgi:hypothetical protein
MVRDSGLKLEKPVLEWPKRINVGDEEERKVAKESVLT